LSIDQPPFNDVTTDGGAVFNHGWQIWLTKLHNVVSPLNDSGATADRPTKSLWVGRPYFDTDLGYMIWLKDNTPTWVNGAGTGV